MNHCLNRKFDSLFIEWRFDVRKLHSIERFAKNGMRLEGSFRYYPHLPNVVTETTKSRSKT